jgi:thioredoxin reductase (NADPH)
VAVVGAGPAGIAASIYLKRAGIDDVALFEKKEVGGLLLNAHLVENYPGFPMGIKGANLCNLMKDQLSRWNIKPIMEEVKQISIENDNFILNTSDGKSKFKIVILATGTKPRELGIPGERELVGKLVFYEIKDLLPKLKPRNICIVIGGSDVAFDYSLNLADNGATVELYFRSKRPRCLPLLEKRVKNCANIRIHPSSTPIDIKERKGKPEIRFRSTEKNANSISDDTATCKSEADYILIACGRKPNKEFLSSDLKKGNMRGLFFAGDVRTGNFRQVGIAVGDGIRAAMSVETCLRS